MFGRPGVGSLEVKALETLDIWKVISWVPVLRIFLDGFCRDAFPGFLKFWFTRLDGDILAYLIPPALGPYHFLPCTEVYKTPEGHVKFRMLKDTEINKLMADATPKEGEEAAASAS